MVLDYFCISRLPILPLEMHAIDSRSVTNHLGDPRLMIPYIYRSNRLFLKCNFFLPRYIPPRWRWGLSLGLGSFKRLIIHNNDQKPTATNIDYFYISSWPKTFLGLQISGIGNFTTRFLIPQNYGFLVKTLVYSYIYISLLSHIHAWRYWG